MEERWHAAGALSSRSGLYAWFGAPGYNWRPHAPSLGLGLVRFVGGRARLVWRRSSAVLHQRGFSARAVSGGAPAVARSGSVDGAVAWHHGGEVLSSRVDAPVW